MIIGFVLLIKGADFFVEGSSDVAKLLKVPSVVIGLTIVALGTSAPEAAVSISAGIEGSNDIALGNVLGSNIFNVLVVVGVCATINAFDVDNVIFRRDLPICIGATALLVLFLLDGAIVLWEALTLLALLVCYITLTVVYALKHRTKDEQEAKPPRKPAICVLFILGGAAAIVFGGDVVVKSASTIAKNLGMTERLVGLTIVALGTSLPELVTSITAARKGDSGLAIGNVVGSNLFNILFILGMSASLHPISAAAGSMTDVLVALGVVVLLFVAALIFKKRINRATGIVLVLLYVAYTVYIILR